MIIIRPDWRAEGSLVQVQIVVLVLDRYCARGGVRLCWIGGGGDRNGSGRCWRLCSVPYALHGAFHRC